MNDIRPRQAATPPHRRGRGAFTLVEMLAVILVIGIIVAVVVDVVGTPIATRCGGETRQTMTAVMGAVQAYYDAKRVYPGADLFGDLRACPQSRARLGDLEEVMKGRALLDGFEQPMRYYSSGGAGGAPYLESAGRDGDFASKDDNIRSDNM